MIRLSHNTGVLKGEIVLPASKSICNRMLVLRQLYEPSMKLDNISKANDSILLKDILESNNQHMDVQDAGTALRFLVAYCAVTPGEWHIWGTDRLHERPISQLVDILCTFGADISYTQQVGKAPLKIIGKQLFASNNLIDITDVKSSQFISAILLIAPKISGNFNLKVDTKMNSYSYVLLTIACLRRMGFSVFVKGQYISVLKQQKFDGEYFLIEPDWSSFYYWMSMIHLATEVDLFFPGIRLDNMQKERKKLFDVGNTGVTFEETRGGMHIVKTKQGILEFQDTYHFSQFPDSAMTFAMLLPTLGCKNVIFRGLESLKYKECDRELALVQHLAKIGVRFIKVENRWTLDARHYNLAPETFFMTYDDHRMAMCVAPLGLLQPIHIENEAVVKKSYPHFWEDLKAVGFQINYL